MANILLKRTHYLLYMSKTYTFYQRLMPIEKLINVGDYEVPDGKPVWLVPTPRRVTVMLADASDSSTTPGAEVLSYQKRRTIMGDIYVADVKVDVEK